MQDRILERLAEFGQSIWLDNISRSLIETGKLKDLVSLGLMGLTSNPTIFEKAIVAGTGYERTIQRLAEEGKTVFEIYDDLTVKDVQDAADIFRVVYERTKRSDGYVSLEVNPLLARDSAGTIKEALRLHKKVNRPNVMFKIPATDAGFPVIEHLIAEGINVNATLIFSVEQYSRTAESYIRGLKGLSGRTKDLSGVASVASVFVSRLDTSVDRTLDAKAAESDGARKKELLSLKGKAAVANCRRIYKRSVEIFSRDTFRTMSTAGARPQRVLWASTSTKDPSYNDVKYVEELIARDTVNTLPDNTLEAYMDHGKIRESVSAGSSDAEDVVKALLSSGIDVDFVSADLLAAGLAAFERSFDALLKSLDSRVRQFAKRA